MSEILIPVLANARVPAWPAEDGKTPGAAEYLPIGEAFTRDFQTDAHFQAVSVPAKPHRLRKAALSKCAVAIVALVFDVDAHELAGEDLERWRQAEQPKIDRLLTVEPGGFVYQTRSGYRVVYLLPKPATIRKEEHGARWRVFYQRNVLRLARDFGITADLGCADWTRLFRLPHATRDRKAGPEKRATVGDPNAIGAWTHVPGPACLDADVGTAREMFEAWQAEHPSPDGQRPLPNPWVPIVKVLGELVSPQPAKPAPAPAPQFTGGESARARVALERECADLAGLPKGARNPACNNAALKLAHFIASGELSQATIEEGLFSAMTRNGSVKDYGAGAVRGTIASGIKAGKVDPPKTPLKQGNPRPQHEPPEPPDGRFDDEDPPEDTRPEIVVSTDAAKMVDASIAALVKGRAEIYQRGPFLVRMTRDEAKLAGRMRPKGTPTISRLPTPRLAELLSSNARFITMRTRSSKGQIVAVKDPTHPPTRTVLQIEARGEWQGIRPIEGITEAPAMRPDGTIIEAAGYDAITGLVFEPNGRFETVPARPSQGDACRACAELLEPVIDFQFVDDAHRAAWLAAALTPFARYAFDGPTPLSLFEASVRGSGKTFLARIVGWIATGREPFALPEASDNDEERKRITSIALQGDRLVLLDNVRSLGSPALEAALTSTNWQDRMLGSMESVRLPLFAVWLATGNNVTIKGDMLRRINLVRLEPDCECPEKRTGFRHPDLFRWVAENRPRLARAALTILRAYQAAGRPRVELTPWGSFERWSDYVRSAIVFAGMPDPYGTRAKLEEGDNEGATLAALLEGWREIGRDHGDITNAITAADAIRMLERGPDGYPTLRGALSELVKGGKMPNARELGYLLRRYRGRVCRGKRLEMNKDRNGITLWYVRGESVTSAGDAGHCGSSEPPYARGDEKGTDQNIGNGGSSPARGHGAPGRNITRDHPHDPQPIPLASEGSLPLS